jgi:hypothetical protein
MTTLSNYMRVATETTPGESVAVGVLIKFGSRRRKILGPRMTFVWAPSEF